MRNSPAGGTLGSAFIGYRFHQAYGALEFKMNNLSPDEEARLVGAAYGAVALVGPNPAPGDTFSFIVSGGDVATPQTISATAQTGDQATTIINRLASAAASNAVLQAAEMYVVAPFGTGPFAQNAIPLPELAIAAKSVFTLSNPTGTGSLAIQITANGTFLPPSSSFDNGKTVVWGYLAILDHLEFDWAASSANLSTIKAGPWTARMNEIGQRLSLYKNWQLQLSKYFEIPVFAEGSVRGDYVSTHRYA